ncbi:MAG: acyl carrier protein [Kineosporiaceae bacterium]
MDATATTLDEVRDVVVETLGLHDRAGGLDAATGLLGELPELDSLGVVQLITALEDRFGFEADVTAEVFETLGSLAGFVEANRS